MEYLSPQGVLLPLVYGTTASPLWLELRGRSAWQATPSWTVYRLACHRLHPWLRVTFAMVPDAATPGSDQQPWSTAPATGPVGRLGRPSVSDPWGVGSFLSPDRPTCVRCPGPPGSCSPVCPLGVLCRVCGVLGLPAPVHRCARLVWCVACAVSWASQLLFTGAPARCVVFCVRCPGPPGSCSPVCLLGVLCCVCGVLGLPAPVHRCARSVCCVACAVSWASWLLFTGVPARCVVLRLRCPGPPGSCSPVCPLGVLRCVCGVLGLPAPVHRCARSVCCFACAVSWASQLLFTGVPARCVVLRVRCPGPPGSCSPVRPLAVLCCVCGVLGLPAPVHLCARSVCCVGCAVSWVSWLLFTGVPARCVVLRVRCPGPPGSCSPVRPLGVLCCVCGVLGLPASVHRCARSVCCVACAVSWASRLLFTGVPARCVVLRVRRPGPPGSCSPVCPLGVLCCVCGVLGLLAPVHRCARSVCCVACAASWASWLLFTGVPARCVVLRVRCPGPPGSCSPVCPLVVLCCVCGVLGLLAPVHQCARSVCCVACAVSWASRLLFTGVPARCVVLRVRCPGPPGSCSPVCPLGVLCCVCGVLGLPAPVQRCARSVCCVACAVSWASRLLFTGVPARWVFFFFFCVCGVLGLPAIVHRCACSVCCAACAASWASWLLFTGVPARCVVLRLRCPGPPGPCSPVCPLGVLCCVCGVLGLLAPVHRCAHSLCCVACAVSWASWLLFTGVPARCVVLCLRRPGPPGSFSPVCPLGVLRCVCGVLGLPAPVHRCARSVCCVACAASWASWLLFTGVSARCHVLRVRCPGPPGSCSPVCPLGVLCCVCGVLGLLAPVHRCARSVCCVAVRGVAAGRSHVHPDGGWRSRQGLGTLRAHTRPSGRRLFVAGRGWVPSGRALVHPDGGWRACACSLWPGRAGRPPGRVVVRLTFSFGRFVFLLCSAPSGLGLPPSLPLPLPSLVALALCFGCFSRPPAARLFVCSRLVCVSRLVVGRSLVVSPPPLPFCVSRFLALLLGALVVFFFLFFSSPSSLVRPRCLRLSLVSGPGCPGPRRCALFALLAFRLSALRALVPLSCFPPGWWLLPVGCCPPPAPPFCLAVFVAAARRCGVLCCAVRPWVRCCAALLRVVSSGVVLSCAVLCSLGAAACCAVPSGAARCPGVLCSAALHFAVLPRAVCVLSWRGGACCCSPLCFVLCVSRGAVLYVPCPLRSVCCCASPCWCACVVLFVWCVLLLVPGAVVCRGAVLGLVARGCLLVACFGVGVPVWPRGQLPCGWCGLVWCPAFLCRVLWCCAVPWCCAVVLCCRVSGAVGACFALLWAVVLCCVVLLVGWAVFCPMVVSACCGALFLVLCVPCLLRPVRCGALLCWLWCPASLCRVLWRCAVVWCCAVVLCCRFAVLLVFALPSCGPSCGASVVCAVVRASCCGVSLCVVVSPWAFCGVVVLLWCVVVSCCAARCPVVSCALCRVLRCRAALRCCAGLLCCAVVCAAGVCFSFCPLFLCVGVGVPTWKTAAKFRKFFFVFFWKIK